MDGDGHCLQTVRGTAEATDGLHIRSGPGTGYGVVGVMPSQSTGTVYCYASGTNINGDPYWDWIALNVRTVRPTCDPSRVLTPWGQCLRARVRPSPIGSMTSSTRLSATA